LWENDKVVRSPAPEGLTKSSEKGGGDSRPPSGIFIGGRSQGVYYGFNCSGRERSIK